MQLKFCDACGKLIKNSFNTFSYKVHLDFVLNRHVGYVDGNGEPVSGRCVTYELCNHCYNRVMIESVKKFKELRKKNIKNGELCKFIEIEDE